MALKVPLIGLTKVLDKLMAAYGAGLTMKLFQNDYVPVDGTVLANLTEATFQGYASQGIAAFGLSVIAGPRAIAQAASLTFTKGFGGVTNQIYGYYVIDAFANLLWAERDPASPIPLVNTGDSYVITPTFSLRSEF
jgi:hypothetical protein